MIFNKKEMTLEELKEKHPEDYNKLMDAAKAATGASSSEELDKANTALANATATIIELKDKAERDEVDTKIREYGSNLGVDKIAEECIKEKMSFTDSLIKMTDEQIKHVKKVADSFDDTSSQAAGAGAEEDDTKSEPETFASAIKLIKKRDDISALEASEKAKVEYKELFDSQYETIEKIED